MVLASPRFLLDADVVPNEKAGRELAGKAAARLRQKPPASAAPPPVAGAYPAAAPTGPVTLGGLCEQVAPLLPSNPDALQYTQSTI